MAKITQTKKYRLFKTILTKVRVGTEGGLTTTAAGINMFTGGTPIYKTMAKYVRRDIPLPAQILKIPCNRCGEIMYKGVGQVITYHKDHKLRVEGMRATS